MRKVVAGEFLTLDGVYQGPGGPDEDVEGGFAHGGWVVPFIDDELGQFIVGMINSADAFLFGRKTYEIFASSWPMTPEDDPVGAKFNGSPKYVASNTITSPEWKGTSVLSGDVVSELTKLKEQEGGDIQISGSGNLIQTLLKNDLVDELVLLIFPVVVGPGKRLFGEGTLPRSLKLVSSQAFSTGVVVSTYQRAGSLGTGAYGIETGNYEPFRAE